MLPHPAGKHAYKPSLLPVQVVVHAVADRFVLKNANNSVLIWSFKVEHMPCGAPGMTFSVAPFTSLEESSAESAMGTIWSSSPWRTNVGTSNFFRSSVRSVSENALMQSCAPLRPTCIDHAQKASLTPCDTFDPGRFAP